MKKNSGAKDFGAIGTCWGSYMVLRECAYPEVRMDMICPTNFWQKISTAGLKVIFEILCSFVSAVQGWSLVAPQPLPHLWSGGGGGEDAAGPCHLPPAVHARPGNTQLFLVNTPNTLLSLVNTLNTQLLLVNSLNTLLSLVNLSLVNTLNILLSLVNTLISYS